MKIKLITFLTLIQLSFLSHSENKIQWNKFQNPLALSQYQNPTDFADLTSIANLSGITYNPIAQEYISVHQDKFCRLDSNFNELFCGSLACGDCEDISYLGINGDFYEYAIVEEGGSEGSVIIVQAPIATNNIRLDQNSTQSLTYAATAGGDSGEGVAYDAINNIFYVCIEDPDMQVLAFNRPMNNNDATYSDGSLIVTEILSSIQLNSILGAFADLSSCYFNHQTGRLLLMSDTAHNLSDVDLSGNLMDQISLPDQQVEGFTFNAAFDQLIIVSEPNNYQVYFSSDVIYSNGFEIKSFITDNN